MQDSPEKIKWHPAFYAAAELELKTNINELQFIPEYSLSKEPIRIDLLIMKNKEKQTSINNEIGHIMKTYNIIEYKSPNDSMTIDDFYKTLGYACLYKGYSTSENQIPIDDMTISLFREAYPRKMIRKLQLAGLHIKEQYPGIYYVTGSIPVSAQIIVTSRLSAETHSSLRILSSHADKEDIRRFLDIANTLSEQGDRNNVDAVLQASISANYELYKEIRSEYVMCDALRELMKDEIEATVNKKVEEQVKQKVEEQVSIKVEEKVNETKLEAVQNIMKSMKWSVQQAMDALMIPDDQRTILLKKMP